MDLVSVVIPTFDSTEFIGDAITSVLQQTYKNIEIIVADDGSKDDTLTVAKKLLHGANCNWRLLEMGENRGPSAARNIGWRAARGTWIQFLDSDDLLMSRKIEREMKFCDEASDDVAAVCSTWRWAFFENGKIEWYGNLDPVHYRQTADYVLDPRFPTASRREVLVRRSALEAIGGFDERLRFWECEEINVRFARMYSYLYAVSDEPQYLWRLRKHEVYIGATDGPGSGGVAAATVTVAAGRRSLIDVR